MNYLTDAAERLLKELARRIDDGKIRPGRPETYPRYREIHDALGLEMHGETVGQSLKHQGLAGLAEWTLAQRHPAVTGLIVSNETNMPGLGYFELFGRSNDDFEWWRGEIVRSLTYNWRQFIVAEPPAVREATNQAEG